MAKGVSVKFKSYADTIPRLLDVIKLNDELKKHNKIVLKPFLKNSESLNTPTEFTEAVLKYCLSNKTPAKNVI